MIRLLTWVSASMPSRNPTSSSTPTSRPLSGNNLTLSNYDVIANSVSLGASVAVSGVVFNNSTVSSGGNLTVNGVGYATGSDPSVDGVYLNHSTISAFGSGHAVEVTGGFDNAITGGGNVGADRRARRSRRRRPSDGERHQ